MLRASAKTNQADIDIQGIAGDATGAAKGIEYGAELMRFAECVAQREPNNLNEARQALLDAAGPEVLVDAAGVAGNFQRMVRIADSIGIKVDDMTTELGQSVREDLNLGAFHSAKNTLRHLRSES